MKDSNKNLRIVKYTELTLWDVKRYKSVQPSFNNVVRLRDILTPYKQPASRSDLLKNKWQIISKINFGGQLFLRPFEDIYTYKGTLDLVPENSLIYSKINVRHGCIYFHEKGRSPFGVSKEYPVFIFDDDKVNGQFLQRLLRSQAFKKLLNTKTTGISKSRVKQSEFLDILIPLPSVKDQKRITTDYEKKIIESESLIRQISNTEKDIYEYVLNTLGIKKKETSKLPKGVNILKYSQLTKWALSHALKDDLFEIQNAKYPVQALKNLLQTFEGGKTPSTSQLDYWNGDISWTSPKDFSDSFYILDSQDHITDKAVKEANMKVFPAGTIVSVFRSGILQHSFPTAILARESAINQDVKAYSLRENVINKKYFVLFVNTLKEYVLLKTAKTSVTVESINTEDFLELQISVPPLNVQHRIVEDVEELKKQITELKAKYELLLKNANNDFEKELFHE